MLQFHVGVFVLAETHEASVGIKHGRSSPAIYWRCKHEYEGRQRKIKTSAGCRSGTHPSCRCAVKPTSLTERKTPKRGRVKELAGRAFVVFTGDFNIMQQSCICFTSPEVPSNPPSVRNIRPLALHLDTACVSLTSVVRNPRSIRRAGAQIFRRVCISACCWRPSRFKHMSPGPWCSASCWTARSLLSENITN